MKIFKIILLLSVLVFSLKVSAQDSVIVFKDSLETLFLDDIQISESLANADNPIFGFYKKTKYSTTEDILSRMPSLSLIRRGNYALEPTIRNFSSGQINLTIDGMHIFSGCTDKMDPVTSYIEPNNLQSIEHEQNTQNGSAIGGGLNFRIKEAFFNNEKPFTANIGTEYHSVSKGTNTLFNSEFNNQKWAFRVSAAYRKHQNYKTGNGEKVNYSQYEKLNFSLSSKYLLSSNEILKLDLIIDDAYNVGYAALPMDVKYAKAKMGGFTYQKFYSGKRLDNIEAKVYANRINHLMDDSERDVTIHMDMPGKSTTIGGYFNAELMMGKHHITSRLDSYLNNSFADMTMFAANEAPMYMLTWGDIERWVTGIFISDKIHVNHHLTLTLNSRVDFASSSVLSEMGKNQLSVFGYDTNESFNELPKNLGAKIDWDLSEKWRLNFSFNANERLPSVSEQFGFYLFNSFDGYDYIGKPDINLEKSKNIEAGFNYKTKKINASTKLYSYFIKDFIIGIENNTLSAMTLGANGVKEYQNISSARLSGAEIQVYFEASEKLTFISTMKYAYGQTSQDTPMPQISPLKNISSLNFKHQNFSFQLESEISSKQNRINEQFGEIVTPSYSIFNFKTSHQFEFNKYNFRFNFGIDNISNKAYRQHLDWGGILRAGRNIYTSINVSF